MWTDTAGTNDHHIFAASCCTCTNNNKAFEKKYNLMQTFNVRCLTKEIKIFSHTICGVSLHMKTPDINMLRKTHQIFLKYCNLLAFPVYTPELFYTTVNVRDIIFKTMTANKHQSQMLRWGGGRSNYININNNSAFLLTSLQNLFTSGKYFSSPKCYNKNTK